MFLAPRQPDLIDWRTCSYSSGFGVIAEPHVASVDLSGEDKWVVISSDGLYNEESRGGGGGLDNQDVRSRTQGWGSI